MALKGRAKIELVNADGTREVIEHGNMITNAVNDFLFSSRGEQSNIMRICNNGDSIVEQLFGGILLFKHTLSEDAGDYYIPSIDTVGYANLNAYSGLDVERGGYNASESGLQEDGTYKLVWDFATSQANGTIKSIALCPNMMGNIGMSNSAVASEQISSTTLRPSIAPYYTDCNLLPRSGDTAGLSNYGYNIVAVNGNIAYAVHKDNLDCSTGKSVGLKGNGGILKLFRFDVVCNGVGLKSKAGGARYIDCIDIQLPAEFLSEIYSTAYGISYSYCAASNKIMLYRCMHSENVSSNGSLKYCEVDLSNFSVTVKSFTNNSPGYIKYVSNDQCCSAFSDYGTYANLFFLDEYVVFVAFINSTDAKIYVSKKSDNTDIKEVRLYNGGETYARRANFRPVFSFGNIFVFGDCPGSQYTSFDYVYVLDMSTGLFKKTNAKEMTYRSNIPLDNKVTWGKTGTYMGLGITVCPFVLTTKNNLDAPVTKTASQTMKITYTLTEV